LGDVSMECVSIKVVQPSPQPPQPPSQPPSTPQGIPLEYIIGAAATAGIILYAITRRR